jgi:hypothetical protein
MQTGLNNPDFSVTSRSLALPSVSMGWSIHVPSGGTSGSSLTQLPHLRAASDYFEAVRGGFGSTGEGPALCFQRGVFGSLARCVEKPV